MMTVKIYDQRLVCVWQSPVASIAEALEVVATFRKTHHDGHYQAELVTEMVQLDLFGGSQVVTGSIAL